jgi:hypothetical protein
MARSRNRARRERWSGNGRAVRRETRKLPQNVKTSSVQTALKGTPATTYAPKVWCDHWQQPFDLGDGQTILASAYSSKPSKWSKDPEAIEARERHVNPDIGFYLDTFWNEGEVTCSPGMDLPWMRSTTQKVLFPWPDRSDPTASLRTCVEAFSWLLSEIEAGKVVDTGCYASHGRTGTLLASLLIMRGMDWQVAMAEVRKRHCNEAIESWQQEDFLRELDNSVNHRDHPRRMKPAALDGGGYWAGAARSMSPATKAIEKAFNDNDDEEYRAWLARNAMAQRGDYYEKATSDPDDIRYTVPDPDDIDRVLDMQEWPSTDQMAFTPIDGYDAEMSARKVISAQCEYGPCPHAGECLDEGECLRCSAWGPPDADGFYWEDWR